MTTLKTIRVHGALAKLLKRRTFKAAVRSPQEAVAFLLANFPETEAYMRPRFFHIRAGGREICEEDIGSPTGVYEEICITPAICGAGGNGVGSIIGGAFLIAAAIFVPFAAPVLLPLGIGLALTGVAQVLTPVPSDRPESTDSGRRDSYNFSGLQQTSREGIPVPVVYGEIITGSVVLSVGVGEDEEELEEQFDVGAGNPNPDQNPVPDPIVNTQALMDEDVDNFPEVCWRFYGEMYIQPNFEECPSPTYPNGFVRSEQKGVFQRATVPQFEYWYGLTTTSGSICANFRFRGVQLSYSEITDCDGDPSAIGSTGWPLGIDNMYGMLPGGYRVWHGPTSYWAANSNAPFRLVATGAVDGYTLPSPTLPSTYPNSPFL